jgi:hypothetical protein
MSSLRAVSGSACACCVSGIHARLDSSRMCGACMCGDPPAVCQHSSMPAVCHRRAAAHVRVGLRRQRVSAPGAGQLGTGRIRLVAVSYRKTEQIRVSPRIKYYWIYFFGYSTDVSRPYPCPIHIRHVIRAFLDVSV